MPPHPLAVRAIAASVIGLGPLAAVDSIAGAHWSNLGGNSGRTGLADAIGPSAPKLLWSGGPTSIISWHPSIEGDRIFVVRQESFVPVGVPNDARVHCLSLETGASLWDVALPYAPGEWTPVLYGVRDGRVFAGRGGNGSSSSAPVYCLDAETGATIWVSAESIATGAYDGVVFAPNGDPIFATNTYVRRVDAGTGATVWNSLRSCSVSGDCGPALAGDAVYVDEAAPGGQVVTRFDLATGARLHSSPVMAGFLSQNTPMADGSGGVYYARTQGAPGVDLLYAFTDTGTEFVERWTAPVRAGAGSEHGIGPDGTVYMLGQEGTLQRRDPFTGVLLDESEVDVAVPATQSHFAIDARGTVYYGNGGFPGTVYSFTAELKLNWSVTVPSLNQGGPSLAVDGTLVVCGSGTAFRAYRTSTACGGADLNCDGVVDAVDLGILLGSWGACRGCDADLDGDGVVDGADLGILLTQWD